MQMECLILVTSPHGQPFLPGAGTKLHLSPSPLMCRGAVHARACSLGCLGSCKLGRGKARPGQARSSVKGLFLPQSAQTTVVSALTAAFPAQELRLNHPPLEPYHASACPQRAQTPLGLSRGDTFSREGTPLLWPACLTLARSVWPPYRSIRVLGLPRTGEGFHLLPPTAGAETGQANTG